MKISENLKLGNYMTFQASKEKPIHRWFYYKEGYSPEIVDYALEQEKTKGVLLDPFCGTGTSLLSAKENNLDSRGIDASELAVFVSKVKCANYEKKDVEEAREFMKDLFKKRTEPSIKWDFELFDPKTAFPKRNLNDILYVREAIEKSECSGKIRDLLLLALVSALPQSSLMIKDGGVLRPDKKKRTMPAKDAFKRKVKQILSDIVNAGMIGKEPDIRLGDARVLPYENESCDIVVTSPPYLNNVDYSKIYGLELSLLALNKEITKQTRGRSLRSFLQRGSKPKYVPEEVNEVGNRIPVVGAYFADMENSISEMGRVLKKGSSAYVVVSNSVIYEEHILVDEILSAIGERLGLQSEIIIGAYRVADVKPYKIKARESIVLLRKS